MNLSICALLLLCLSRLSLSLSTPLDQNAEDDSIWSEDHEVALAFLLASLPPSERQMPLPRLLPALKSNVRMAMGARESHPWTRSVPWAMFLEYVLPYASLDEPRDSSGDGALGSWRGWMKGEFGHLTKHATSVNEAAMKLNENIWIIYNITFKAGQTPLVMSPVIGIPHEWLVNGTRKKAEGFTELVMDKRFASCTGLSIFLVDAMRSLGLPARVVGTASWVQGTERRTRADQGSQDLSGRQDRGSQDLLLTPSSGIQSYDLAAKVSSSPISSSLARGSSAQTVNHPPTLIPRGEESSLHGSLRGEESTLLGSLLDPDPEFRNHNWVEVFDHAFPSSSLSGGSWSFMGAGEFDPHGLNRSWFHPEMTRGSIPGSRLHGIWAARYSNDGHGKGSFPMAWKYKAKWVHAEDVTQTYQQGGARK